MDGNPTAPDGQGIQPVELVLPPLEGHVVETSTDDRGQNQDRQEIGDQSGIDAALFAKARRQQQPEQHGNGNQQAVPAQRKGPQLKQQGPRRCEQSEGHQTPSAA
jgi:hypothetical protein